MNFTKKDEAIQVANLLHHCIELGKVDKILNTFFSAFQDARDRYPEENETFYLHGTYKQGGTKSSRLSSKDPNLTNLPSGGTVYAKPTKMCFQPPAGWVMGGIDADSLEDRISALTTNDPMKLKVYIDNYDGHSLRAYYYFRSKMPDINPDSVLSINSIKSIYPQYRQDSKAPTFALTYQGTYTTLMKNCGFDEDTARSIEDNYHDLYKVSDEWVQDKLDQAVKDGYVTLAFGTRLRTPLLKASGYDSCRIPEYKIAAEGRTAGNALGQGYCILTLRACNEFHQRLMASPYRLDVKLIATIHDAIYVIFKEDINVATWVNTNIVECMQWQELPEIQHDQVKLTATFGVFHPSWAKETELPKFGSAEDILEVCSTIE